MTSPKGIPVTLLSSSRVVVVGGTSGIGLAVARAAAAHARVTIGSRSEESVKRALAELPGTVQGRAVDVTSPASLESFFAAAGPFDHLVYTAGDALVRGPIGDYDARQARDFFDVRLFSALTTVRLALPTLNASGSVTLTSGAAAYHGGAGRLLGSTVSAAVIAAARSLAIELAPIRVNAVAPGVVRTPLWADLPGDARERLFASAGAVDAEDVAKAYLGFLDQGHVTGNVAVVEGRSAG